MTVYVLIIAERGRWERVSASVWCAGRSVHEAEERLLSRVPPSAAAAAAGKGSAKQRKRRRTRRFKQFWPDSGTAISQLQRPNEYAHAPRPNSVAGAAFCRCLAAFRFSLIDYQFLSLSPLVRLSVFYSSLCFAYWQQ